ncbi:ABC transporter permease [Fulvivirgaceae bacterium BMA12]|uniref:ABC transporter permease n=1 Tax=Agaribacillus aureus TaxID=3051825 RepID=A0ABT8L3E9_9BACT|nr:ABC transporter permease [Fulvivirgaceae bacterium BMA12]
MKTPEKPKPPALANWLASKFINKALLEEFFGDLEEIYKDRIAVKGKFYAKCMYWVDTLHLMIGFTSFNLFKTQNNHTVMYKHYLLISGRNLLRNKVYSFINILGLAVGMGVCLTISQYVYFEWSFDRFHDNFQNTYRIVTNEIQGDEDHVYATSTFAIGPSAKETIPEIKQFVRIVMVGATVAGPDSIRPLNKEFLHMLFVDNTFLQVFDFPLKLGNKESVFDEKFNIVITEKTAHKYFGADDPIGKTLTVGGKWTTERNYTVSGVLEDLPINSHLQFEFLMPMESRPGAAIGSYTNSDAWEWDNIVTYVTIDEAADLEAVSKKLDRFIIQNRGKRNTHHHVVEKAVLQPIMDIHLKSGSLLHDYLVTSKGNIQNVRIFSVIALFILLIAWVNYINLSTARSMHRAKEVGIRKSIGAFRKQLIIQFMTEAVLINLTAALLAISIAFSALPILSGIVGRELSLSFLQMPVFWVSFSSVILLGSLLSGLYPAFVLSAFKPVNMLGSGKVVRSGSINLRRGLIVFQFLISLLLIAGTYLVYKQVTFMKNKELGIDMEKILVLKGPRVNLDEANLKSIMQAFKTKAAGYHSISDVTSSATVPGGRAVYGYNSFRKLGEPATQNQDGNLIWGGLNFPEVYDFEFLAGSSFTPEMSNGDGVVIINEEAVRVFGLGSPENAIQETLVRIKGNDVLRRYRVIGVVKNFHWHSLKDGHIPYIFSFSPGVKHFISFKMNLSNIPESLAHIEKTYKSFFPGNPFDYFFLDDAFNKQYQADVQFGNLFLAFTTLAIFIACIGLFALVSYSATLRIKEIGIRKVLGAGIANLMILLSKEYLVLLSIATVLAFPAILYWGGSWLENYAFRIDIGFDLFVIPASVLALASIITVSYRTYATAKANPVDSLRKE